jgi:Flp pilus assembly protein TadG
MRAPRSTLLRVRGSSRAATGRSRGQSLVEFSLILGPLLLLLLGIVQFGFIFNTFVTITNATREAAREGSIYVYDRTMTKAVNDLTRNEEIREHLTTSLNGLSKISPQFANSSTWTSSTSGTTVTYTTGDLKVIYELPGTVTDSDTRMGYRITVRATYHLDLIIPLIGNFLPKDAGGRLALQSETTMTVN